MKNDVQELLVSVDATLKSMERFKKLYDKELAFSFDPIRQIWGFQETSISAFLAYFLNPKQSHGQGRIYLDSFLLFLKDRGFDYPELLTNEAKVRTEYETPQNGRFDILIEFTDAGIVIENKI